MLRINLSWHLSLLSFQITVQRDSGLDVTAPKHGKIDAKNDPHVGGNQWAGGTGNRFLTGSAIHTNSYLLTKKGLKSHTTFKCITVNEGV